MKKIPNTRLTQLRFIEMRKEKAYYLYKCLCGRVKIIRKADVDSRKTKSCGCWRRDNGRRMVETLVEKGVPTQFKAGDSHNKGNQFWKKRKKHVSGTEGKRRYKDKDGKFYYA